MIFKLLLCLTVLVEAVAVPMFIKQQWIEWNIKSLSYKAVASLAFVASGILCSVISGGFSEFKIFITTGLVCGFFGDVLLHNFNKIIIAAGFLFFIAGHVMYIIAYLKKLSEMNVSFISLTEGIILITVMIAAVLFFKFSDLNLGALTVPILIYGMVITFMVIKAVHLSLICGSILGGLLLSAGCIGFILSDFLMSIALFDEKLKKSHALNIARLWPYFIGQMMIAFSLLFI